MARRSENPLMVLVLGLFTVALFGGALVWLSDNRPILRLRPVLEQSYGLEGIETRFVPGTREQATHIVVTLPDGRLVPDEPSALVLARRALEEYVSLAEQRTQVRACVLRVRGDPPEQVRARVLMSAVQAFAGIEQKLTGLEQRLTKLGLSDARAVVGGTTASGAALRVTGRATDAADAERLADKAGAALGRHPAVGRYELTVRHPRGAVRRAGGRDAAAP